LATERRDFHWQFTREKQFATMSAASGYSNQYYVIENGEPVMQFGDGANPSDPTTRTLTTVTCLLPRTN
jgi:hypothetical protein